MNTPDTEWREDTTKLLAEIWELLPDIKYKQVSKAGVIKYAEKEFISILTSRDTYWKERVEPLRRIIRRMDRELKDYEDIALYDIYAMAFYDDTGIWPPGKSAPMEMHHEFDQTERSKKYTEWHQALDTLLDNLK